MPTSIAILGFAHAHVSTYCRSWQKEGAERVRRVAGYDHDAGRRAKAADELAIEPADELADVLGRDDVDAVVIGAETAHHADLVERAAAAGKAVVLQKPMALTLEEADRIVAAVDEAGVAFTMAWQMRVDPQNVLMKALIEEGTFGRVYMVRRRHGLSMQRMKGIESSWHVVPAMNRGMWADDASHAMDFLLWLLGEPESVTAEVETLRSETIPDDHGIAVFRYPDGTLAEVASSFLCLAGENTTEIVGERGVCLQNYGDGPSCSAPRPADAAGVKWLLEGADAWTESDLPVPDAHGERIAGLAEPLLAFLEGRRGPIATAEEGRTALRMMLASYRAAEEGRRVALDELA